MDQNKERAISILTDDAQRKSAKAQIDYAIENAISTSGAGEHTTVESLLELYGLKYYAADLKQAALYFAKDMANEETWQAYHAPAPKQ